MGGRMTCRELEGPMIPAILLGVVLLVLLCVPISVYNALIARKNQTVNLFGTIDALLKKRHDLIPNLVASVKEYMKHERELLTKVTEERARAMSGQLSEQDRMKTENAIGRYLRGIMVAVENYPNLKANEHVLQLLAALNEVEEQISAARRAYNAAVTDYNNAVQMFPSNLFATMMGFAPKQVLETPEEERKPVDVDALFKS